MPRFPHALSDARLGLLLIVLPLVGGLCWLYNAYRMGKLNWKPAKPANPRLVSLFILAGILTAILLLVLADQRFAFS